MTTKVPRLLLVDQSLRGFEGHHYEYDLAIIQAASRLGVPVDLIAHRAFAEEHLGSARVIGTLGKDWIAARRGSLKSAAAAMASKLPTNLSAPIFLLKRSMSKVARESRATSQFGSEIFSLMDETGITERDHAFIHTISEPEVLSLAKEFEARESSPHLHVLLRFDGTPRISEMQRIVKRHLDSRWHTWTDSDSLRKQYQNLGIEEIEVLPIPICISLESNISILNDCATVSYLGSARIEKGYQLLPALMDDLADLVRDRKLRFVVQCNFRRDTAERFQIERVTRRLRAQSGDALKLIDRPLTVDEFKTQLAQTDLLLLPYDKSAYRSRTSGLLIQAASAGVPVILPEETWMHDNAPAGAFIAFGRHRSLQDSVRVAIESLSKLKESAANAKNEVASNHQASVLIRRIMDHGKTR